MIYRTDDLARWGVGKGANLTPVEVDGNFWELAERLVAVEASAGAAANRIANVSVVGSQMTVWLEDGTALGPYTLPTAMIRYRGDWTVSTVYSEMDLVAVPDTGIYLVLRDHTSDAAAFDASAQDGEGNPLYRFLFPIGAGAAALADLTDVADWLAPDDGQVLVYDEGLGAWDAATLSFNINDLDGIYQPENATPGQVLAFNTTGTGWWEPTDLPAGGGASALGDLTDVTLAAPAAADFLRHDGTGWANAALAWADIPDRPATFTPSAHIHDWSEVTGRPATIDALPEAVGAAGTVLKAGAGGTITWGTDETSAGGGGSVAVSDGGTQVLAAPTDLNFAGAGVSVADDGDGTVTVTIAGGGGAGASALDDLSDVTISIPAAGEVLRHDGAGWVNAAVAWGDLAGVPASFPPDAHVHTAADISDFSEALDDRVAALLVAGTNITLTYDDATGALTIDAGGGAGGGATTFLGLTDTPGAFGTAGQVAAVNPTEDGVEWVDPASGGGLADAPANGNLYGRKDGAWTSINLPIPDGAYRYWRMRLISEDQGSDGSDIRIGEVQFRAAAGVAETTTGGTAFGDFPNVARLFDGSGAGGNTVVVPSPYTDKVGGYDFGEPVFIEEVAVYDSTNLSTYAPDRFVIEASNDFVTWVEVARADPVNPAWSGFGTVSRTLPVTIPEELVSWSALTGVPATVDALPAAVGAAGTVLKAGAGGTVAWGTSGGSAGYRGARPNFTSTPAATTTWAKVPLSASGVDTGDAGFDDANDQFVVPAGVTLIRCRMGVVRTSGTHMNNQWKVYRNGAALDPTSGSFALENSPSGYSNTGATAESGPIPVSAGDVIDLRNYAAGTTMTYQGWFEMEVLA